MYLKSCVVVYCAYILFMSVEVSTSVNQKHNSAIEKEMMNGKEKLKTSPGAPFFGKSFNLTVNQMLNKSKKNKTLELTTEMSIEEVTMSDSSTELTSFENGTEDFSDSTVNSTDATELSTEQTETTTSVVELKKHKKPKIWKSSIPKMNPKKVCLCDLTKSVCDVNCCCDAECLESHRSVFSECVDELASAPPTGNMLQHCHTKDTFFFKNNTPWLMYQEHTPPASHLFCVIKDNLPPRLLNKEPKAVTSVEELDKAVEGYFQWRHTEPQEEVLFDGTKSYTYGDNIWIITNSTLKLLELPSASVNTHCDRSVKMRYLMGYRGSCIPGHHVDLIQTLYSGIDDAYFVASPHLFNATWINNIQDCPQNVCIPITSYICDESSCLLTNETEEITSNQVFISLGIYLYCNGSAGYTNASIFFGIKNKFTGYQMLEQEFEVHQSFIGKNISIMVQELSGNPGYQNGKPIIVSKVIEDKGNETESNTLDFFSTSNVYPLRNVLAYPKNRRGNCVLSNLTHNEIRYRENVQFSCTILSDVSDFVKEENATKICVHLQEKLLQHLPHSQSKIYVSKIGNPSANLYDWIELMHDTSNSGVIKGTFQNDDHSVISCLNIVLTIEHLFIYAAVEQQVDIPKQMHLVGASLRFLSEVDSFSIVNDTVATKLMVRSRFVDTTKPQPLRYARGPHFHIHLPQDFFYPFAFNGDVRHASHFSMLSNYLSILILCGVSMIF